MCDETNFMFGFGQTSNKTYSRFRQVLREFSIWLRRKEVVGKRNFVEADVHKCRGIFFSTSKLFCAALWRGRPTDPAILGPRTRIFLLISKERPVGHNFYFNLFTSRTVWAARVWAFKRFSAKRCRRNSGDESGLEIEKLLIKLSWQRLSLFAHSKRLLMFCIWNFSREQRTHVREILRFAGFSRFQPRSQLNHGRTRKQRKLY